MESDPLTSGVGTADRLMIGKTDRSVYTEILESSQLKKGRLQNKEVFLLSAVLGFQKGQRIPIKGGKEGYFLVDRLKEADLALMDAIAIKETESLDIINDKKEVFNIIEEYAHAGIQLLGDMVFDKDSGSFIKKFEADLRECLPNKH